jgi:hypothetical protein
MLLGRIDLINLINKMKLQIKIFLFDPNILGLFYKFLLLLFVCLFLKVSFNCGNKNLLM